MINNDATAQVEPAKKSSAALGTRVPLSIEKDLLSIVQRENRSISQAISLLLTRYMPINNVMRDNKYILTDVDHAIEDSKGRFEFDIINDEKPTKLQVVYSNGLDPDAIFHLDKETVIKMAANFVTFLNEVELDG
jgi:hypothetical protein